MSILRSSRKGSWSPSQNGVHDNEQAVKYISTKHAPMSPPPPYNGFTGTNDDGSSKYEDIELKTTLFNQQNPDYANGYSDPTKIDSSKTESTSRRFLCCKKKPQQKPVTPPTRQLKTFELYKFADALDILLMFIGTIASLGTGAVFPLMMMIYQGVTNTLIEIGVASKPYNNATETNGDFNPKCIPNVSAVAGKDLFSEVRGMIKWYIVLGCASILCYWIGYSLWMISAERQVRRMRFRLFRSMMNQEMSWFDVRNPGELSNRLVSDLDKIRDGLGDKRADFLSLIARLIGGLVFAFVKGWKLALVFISVSPLIIAAFNLTVRVIMKYTVKEIQAFSKASAVAQEVLGAIRTVTAFGGQKKEEARFSENLTDAKRIGIQKGLFLGLCQGFAQIAIFGAFAVTFWYGPYLVRNECENYSGGTVIVVFVSCLQSTFSISQIVPNIQAFAEAAGSAGYVFDLIARVSKIDAFEDNGEQPKAVSGDIELQNVTFTYPARKDTPVLNNISMKIPSGKTVALVGASGCGKSTSIQLIQRFYDPDNGRVLLDGRDIRTLNVAWLRTHIGVVSQEPVLFTGSIEENIRFGKPDATDDEVVAAAKMANAHDFIMDLPDNYKTSSGDKLSGGQKQRVAIARALISNPKILLLDEATSALDNTSERVVQDALDKAKEGRTTIVIAHRLSTIRNADLIVALDKGQVIENGTHNELMQKIGLYYELVTAQQKKQKDGDDESSDDDEQAKANEKAGVHHPRTTSLISAKSISSDMTDTMMPEEDDLGGIVVKNRRFFRKPFIIKILQLNLPELNWIILGCITSLAFGAITPVFALIFSSIYELFAETDLNKANAQTRTYALIIFFIGLTGAICQCTSSIAFSKSGEALTMRMRIISFASMLRQELSWFDREENNVGALVTQLSSDTSSLKGLSGLRVGVMLNAAGAIICALTIAFIAGWKLTLIILLFVPFMVFTGMLQGRRMANTKQRGKKTDGTSWSEKGGTFATEAIDSIRTVVGLHQEDYFITRYEDCFNKDFKRSMITIQLQALGTALANSLMFFIHAAAFGYGTTLVEQKEMEFQNVFRVFSVITFGAMSVGRSTAMIPDYAKGKASAIRILTLNKRQSRIDPNDPQGAILDKVVGKVEFQQVKFCYPSRPKLRVLKSFDLFVSDNQTTALVGPSGSGKSTCVALILRFYDPYHGTILLDGHDVRSLNISWLRSQLGLVQQEPILFNLSIRDNIAYGDNSRIVTQEEIEAAARKANIHDRIISFPERYNTLCGSKGGQMSGGEKQRIAIARALVRQPKLLLLDEATSALDVQSEKIVQDALNVARNGRTCLTIAHRLSTIRDSEKIAVVDRGRLKESGTHDELMQKRGIYYKLNMAQERHDDDE